MTRIVAFIFIIALFATGVVMLEMFPPTIFVSDGFVGADGLRVTFLQTETFFTDDFTVELRPSRADANIFFTTDGSAPTPQSLRYEEPIRFSVGDEVSLVTVRAIAVADGVVSAPATRTFFHGPGVDERFNTLVFSLSTAPRNLYDHYEGIFVEGAIREAYLLENPNAEISPLTPANFNQRGRAFERPIYVEIFYPTGVRALNMAAGVRVTGAYYPRGESAQSLRLISRRDYTPHAANFRYQLFPGDISLDGRERAILSYNSLILRNGGFDRNYGVLRHELASVLAHRAGFDAVTPVRPAALFINGQYYGYTWLQVRIDEHYLQELFVAPTREFDVVGRGEFELRDATYQQELALAHKNQFALRDLTNNEEFALLEGILDVESMLRHYAFQIWLGNDDWPQDNLYRWRYTGIIFEGMPPELDGRWRYAMFGMCQTFGHFDGDYTRDTFHRIMDTNNEYGALLRAVLARPDMAARFAEIFEELMEAALNYETVREVLENLYGEISTEVYHTIRAGLLGDSVTQETVAAHHASILAFAQNRHIYIMESLENLIG